MIHNRYIWTVVVQCFIYLCIHAYFIWICCIWIHDEATSYRHYRYLGRWLKIRKIRKSLARHSFSYILSTFQTILIMFLEGSKCEIIQRAEPFGRHWTLVFNYNSNKVARTSAHLKDHHRVCWVKSIKTWNVITMDGSFMQSHWLFVIRKIGIYSYCFISVLE